MKSMKITVLNNQTLVDISMMYTGKAENLIPIAMANNKVPTDKPEAGEVLTIPDGLEVDNDIVRYYQANRIQPATALSETVQAVVEPELSCEEKLYECFK